MIIRLFPALLLAAVLSGCGPSTGDCGPSNCAGCCDERGACQPGGLQFACGSLGAACTSCSAQSVCSAGLCISPGGGCTPKTCEGLGKDCGQVPNGCGGVLECGGCESGEACGASGVPNVCGPGTCTPTTCDALGAECGQVSDGCATLLECGTCSAGSTCGGGGPNRCGACTPTTCGAQGKNCGTLDDGCGGQLQCGSCSGGQSCGGGGIPNVCGTGQCTPTTCGAQGKNCGQLSDGCGGQLECGTCAGGLTCGGGGTQGVCGATCAVTCPEGYACNNVGECSGGNPQNLVLETVGHTVSGTVTVNGAAPTKSSAYCNASGNLQDNIGTVRFTDASKGYSAQYAFRCNSPNWGWSVLLPPGTYEVRVSQGGYSQPAGVNLMPVDYLAHPGLVVNGPVSGVVLNEVGHTVSGTVTVSGAPPTKSSAYCNVPGNTEDPIGAVRFTDAAKGYSAQHYFRCSSPNWSWSVLLPPGTYEVRVSQVGYAQQAGVNLLPVDYLAHPGLVVNGPVSNVVLNEVGHTVSGTVTVNGAPPTKGAAYCNAPGNTEDAIGTVRFTDASRGYSAQFAFRCSSPNWGWSVLLPPGTYEVRVSQGGYSQPAGVNLMPVDYLAHPGLVVNGPVSGVVLNEVGHTVSGTVTVNGAPPTKSASYCNVSGNTEDPIGSVSFTDASRGYSAQHYFRCSSPNWSWSVLLPPGTYEVRVSQVGYSQQAGVNLLPVDYLAHPALVVNGPVSNVVLNEVGHTVSGTVTVNGAPPTKSAAYCNAAGNLQDHIGTISFRDGARGYSGAYYFRCNSPGWNWTLTLPPGTYDFRVSHGGYSQQAGVNLLPVDYLAASRVVIP